MNPLNIATSLISTFVRPINGISVSRVGAKPEEPLQLYDIENCPYCRLVREAMTELDLDVLILPCPKGGSRFRPELKARGGKAQFPYLVDPNTGVEMYESLDIVEYLFDNYADVPEPGRCPSRCWSSTALNRAPTHAWCGRSSAKWRFPTSCATAVAPNSPNGCCHRCASCST